MLASYFCPSCDYSTLAAFVCIECAIARGDVAMSRASATVLQMAMLTLALHVRGRHKRAPHDGDTLITVEATNVPHSGCDGH